MLLGDRVQEIVHFGSTSIPGIIAKPIIDMQIAVDDFEDAFKLVSRIERLGYSYNGENDDILQHNFTKGNPVGIHLYLLESSDETWARRTAFRDYLKNNRESAVQYADLKKRLAYRFSDDLKLYQKGKLEFVKQVVRAARGEVGMESTNQLD